MTDYKSLSLWLDTLDDPLMPRPPLASAETSDVVIVGAGYTGLWAAYYLLKADPTMQVVIVEKEIAGFGASGRNGGWCSALFPAGVSALTRRHGREAALAMRAAMRATVDEVGAVVADEGIACDWVKGGTVELARTPAQLVRAWAAVSDEVSFLEATEASALVGASSVLGGTFTPD